MKPGSKRGTDRRTWIRVAGITWNCGRKEKLCSIFELLNCTVIGCHSEAFLSLSYVWADSQVRVGGRCLRSLCWKPLMKNHKQLWSLKLLYTAECEEGKAVPESYCLNFCTLKVFFLVLLLFLYLVAGVCCLFFKSFFRSCHTTVLWSWAPLWWDKTIPEHNKKFQGMSDAIRRCSLQYWQSRSFCYLRLCEWIVLRFIFLRQDRFQGWHKQSPKNQLCRGCSAASFLFKCVADWRFDMCVWRWFLQVAFVVGVLFVVFCSFPVL